MIQKPEIPALSVPPIANFALFQFVWLVTVIGAARGAAWPGLAALAFFLTVHRALSATAKADHALCVLTIALGTIVETLNSASGFIVYRDPAAASVIPPIWILVLWCNLALILNNSAAWLLQRPVLAAVLGAIGGSLSYVGGVALGAAEFGVATRMAVPVLAVSWAILAPLLFAIARRVNRVFAPTAGR